VLRRLAVFAGGFSLQQARALVGGSGIDSAKASLAWSGQACPDLIAETIVTVDATADQREPRTAVARKVARLPGDLETHVSGQSAIIIDYVPSCRSEGRTIRTVIAASIGRTAEVAPAAEFVRIPPGKRACNPVMFITTSMRLFHCRLPGGILDSDEGRRRRAYRSAPLLPGGVMDQRAPVPGTGRGMANRSRPRSWRERSTRSSPNP
jgi:hypothetical protein